MYKIRLVIFAILMIGNALIFASTKQSKYEAKTLQDLLYAIAEVESNNNDNKVGDDGKAIGRYQIHEDYWLDADMPDGEYEDCKDKAYAERVVLSYWQKYGAFAVRNRDFKFLARLHNGGPDGNEKDETLKYWEKVKMELDKL